MKRGILSGVLLIVMLMMGACAAPGAPTAPPATDEVVMEVSPHDIQAKFDGAGDDAAKQQVWQQHQGQKVRWVGELKNVEVTDDGVVGIFMPGGWGIFSPGGWGVKDAQTGEKPALRPGGEGVFSPGGWGLVSVFVDKSSPKGFADYEPGDKLVFEGVLASAGGVPGGVPAKYGLGAAANTKLKAGDFGLVNGIILGGVDSFYEIGPK